jgi:hypothetical protein
MNIWEGYSESAAGQLQPSREYKLGDDASRDLFAKGAKLISKVKPSRRLISKDVASDGPHQDGPYYMVDFY